MSEILGKWHTNNTLDTRQAICSKKMMSETSLRMGNKATRSFKIGPEVVRTKKAGSILVEDICLLCIMILVAQVFNIVAK